MPFISPGRVTAERAEAYDRVRFPYSAKAVARMMERIGEPLTAIADIGCGTGLVTRHLVGESAMVYAIDPEPEMLRVALTHLGTFDSVVVRAGFAEDTGLDDRSVDLIVVGNAHHRFDPEPTIAEFRRILKPRGWLALFSYGPGDITRMSQADRAFAETMEGAIRDSLVQVERRREHRDEWPAGLLFGEANTETIFEAQMVSERWEDYWSALAWEWPTPADCWYDDYMQAVKAAFEASVRSGDGTATIHYSTQIVLGQPSWSPNG